MTAAAEDLPVTTTDTVVEVDDLHVTFAGREGGTARAVDGVNRQCPLRKSA